MWEKKFFSLVTLLLHVDRRLTHDSTDRSFILFVATFVVRFASFFVQEHTRRDTKYKL